MAQTTAKQIRPRDPAINDHQAVIAASGRTDRVGWDIGTCRCRRHGAGVTTPAMLIDLAVRAELFHTANGTAFADLMIEGHRETWPIRGARFRSWLRRRYYEATGE